VLPSSELLAEQDCCSLPTTMDREPPMLRGYRALLNTGVMVTDVVGIALIHATASQLPVPATYATCRELSAELGMKR
jgi:hypothetical protein